MLIKESMPRSEREGRCTPTLTFVHAQLHIHHPQLVGTLLPPMGNMRLDFVVIYRALRSRKIKTSQ